MTETHSNEALIEYYGQTGQTPQYTSGFSMDTEDVVFFASLRPSEQLYRLAPSLWADVANACDWLDEMPSDIQLQPPELQSFIRQNNRTIAQHKRKQDSGERLKVSGGWKSGYWLKTYDDSQWAALCPSCGKDAVKNGRRSDGTQRFLCKTCGRRFQ